MDLDRKCSLCRLLNKEWPQDFIDIVIRIPTTDIFKDLKMDSVFAKKNFAEERFFAAERLKAIKWKSTSERIDILGYECRRSKGLYMDSIYVVSRYYSSIKISKGLSFFGGAPGIILVISLFFEHVNIFATKIETKDQPIKQKEGHDNRSRKFTLLEFGDYMNKIPSHRFDKQQWDMSFRGIGF